ncbi:MAG: hypothetical protein ACLVHE_07145 [Dialister invisus]
MDTAMVFLKTVGNKSRPWHHKYGTTHPVQYLRKQLKPAAHRYRKELAAPAPAIKTIMKRKRKIFFTVEDFSLCCLRISEFLMKAGAPLINQCISHIKAFIQKYQRLNQKIIIFVPL